MIAARSRTIGGPPYPKMFEEMDRELNNIIEFTLASVNTVDNPGFWGHGMVHMLRALAQPEALVWALTQAELGSQSARALQSARAQAQKVVARAWAWAWEGPTQVG